MQKYYRFFTIALFLFSNISHLPKHFSDGDCSLFTPDSRRCDLMQALPFKKKIQNGRSLCILILVEKNNISGLFEDSDAENTKKQRKYAVSHMYLKNYDISCLINSSAKSNSLFWYYIKQKMNVSICAMVRIFSFGERWNVLFNSAVASLNRTFHLSPHENILTIALINIHYLYPDFIFWMCVFGARKISSMRCWRATRTFSTNI